MASRNWLLRASMWTLAMFVCGVAAQAVRADVLADPTENFNFFGKQKNFCIPGTTGVCAAAAAINSFFFLENQYPKIYKNYLTPFDQGKPPNQTDQADTEGFAFFYYDLPSHGLDNLAGWNDYMTVKQYWINTLAPGTSVFTSMYIGSPYKNGHVTTAFLTTEEQAQEDVELFVSGVVDGKNVAHVITVTGISGMKMTYQDSNKSGVMQTANLKRFNGALTFVGLPGSGYDTQTFTIDAAFAESPKMPKVPEPSSLIFLGTGIVSLIGRGMRRSVSRQGPPLLEWDS